MGTLTITNGVVTWDLVSRAEPASSQGALDRASEKTDVLDAYGVLTFNVTNANTKQVVNVIPNAPSAGKFTWSRLNYNNANQISIQSDNGIADAGLSVTVYYK